MLYKGSCHCGDIRVEVEGDLNEVIDCDCFAVLAWHQKVIA